MAHIGRMQDIMDERAAVIEQQRVTLFEIIPAIEAENERLRQRITELEAALRDVWGDARWYHGDATSGEYVVSASAIEDARALLDTDASL